MQETWKPSETFHLGHQICKTNLGEQDGDNHNIPGEHAHDVQLDAEGGLGTLNIVRFELITNPGESNQTSLNWSS